jgi:N-methylhydantoinase B
MAGVVVVAAPDPRTGRDRVNVVNVINGGGGGRRGCDGLDAAETRYSFRSVPVEVTEVETVLVIHAIRLVPDSRRAGEHVGGAAIEMELENTANRAIVTARNMNRFVFTPWGFRGGEQGLLGRAVLNPGREQERSIGKITVLELGRGDVVRITSSCGGGFGDPLKRDVEAVALEIENGMLSVDRAAAVYGAVCDESGHLDRAATSAERGKRTKSKLAEFALGDAREREDQIWPLAMRQQLASRALTFEQSLRSPLVDRVHKRMVTQGQGVTPEILNLAIEEELAALSGARSKAA